MEDLDVINPLQLTAHLRWSLKDCNEQLQSCPVLDPRSKGWNEEKNVVEEKKSFPAIFFQTGIRISLILASRKFLIAL